MRVPLASAVEKGPFLEKGWPKRVSNLQEVLARATTISCLETTTPPDCSRGDHKSLGIGHHEWIADRDDRGAVIGRDIKNAAVYRLFIAARIDDPKLILLGARIIGREVCEAHVAFLKRITPNYRSGHLIVIFRAAELGLNQVARFGDQGFTSFARRGFFRSCRHQAFGIDGSLFNKGLGDKKNGEECGY